MNKHQVPDHEVNEVPSSTITGTWKMMGKASMGTLVKIIRATRAKNNRAATTRTKINKASTMRRITRTKGSTHSSTVTMSNTYCLPLPTLMPTLQCPSWWMALLVL